MGNKRKKNGKSFTRKRRAYNDGMFGSKKRKTHSFDAGQNSFTAQEEQGSQQHPSITELVPVEPETIEHTDHLDTQTNATPSTSNVSNNNSNPKDEKYDIVPEHKQNNTPISGRRFIDVIYFFNKLKEIAAHKSLCNCGFECLSLLSENRTGLLSKFKLKCDMCLSTFYVHSEDPISNDNVDINFGAVVGIITSGIGYSQFEEIASSINVPIFTEKYFSKLQNTVFDKWEETAVEEMEAAAERERQAAIAEGRMKNGIALIDVYADGCWSARSYGNNYKAMSGAAAIIGRKFGEVLFMAVRNKYCVICARAEKKNISPKEHVCYKNYEGSSTGMEAEIISEGFKQSIDMYNIIYKRLIADGDSATYAKILALNPYPNTTITKIECRNHILRNLCNKLRALAKDVKYPLKHRKLLSDPKIMIIRRVVTDSIKEQKKIEDSDKKIENLHRDVLNSINHAFGDHRNCKEYYCNKEKSQQSAMEQTNSTFWFRLKVIIGSVAAKSKSLSEDVDTNTVERFNSVVAKIVGGKRINFSTRRSYQGRCAAAVVLFNNKFPRYTKKYLGKSPKTSLKKMEERRNLKKAWNKKHPFKKNRFQKLSSKQTQNEYGSNIAAPDMSKYDFDKAKKEFLKNLNDLTNDKDKIQKETSLQRDSCDWVEIRKNMITASNFGKIVKRRKNKSCANLVKNILYTENISHVSSIAHGVENEKLALDQLARQLKLQIDPCGLFVDKKYPFIGATPDGLVSDDIIVEVKCPITAFKKGIDTAIKENKVQMYRFDKKKGRCQINVNCNWYYQVQGQLHVTQRKKCVFAIWSGENTDLKVEYIERDDAFWEKIEKELVSFYLQCILPEIVDSRRNRGMPIRDSISVHHSPPPPIRDGISVHYSPPPLIRDDISVHHSPPPPLRDGISVHHSPSPISDGISVHHSPPPPIRDDISEHYSTPVPIRYGISVHHSPSAQMQPTRRQLNFSEF